MSDHTVGETGYRYHYLKIKIKIILGFCHSPIDICAPARAPVPAGVSMDSRGSEQG